MVDQTQVIQTNLISMYKKLATQFEAIDNVEDALYYYKRCLEVAEKSDDHEEEGIISHKIGNLLFTKFDDYSKSIAYQKKYLESAQVQNTNNVSLPLNASKPRRNRCRPTPPWPRRS